MNDPHAPSDGPSDSERADTIVTVLNDAFADLMEADPDAFRVKYRKMAADPFAFYRGTACLYYHDVTQREDPYVDEQSSAIWIHGDLHAENFGTYMSSAGRLVFDVNDFDEAYVGHYTWDLMRFVASLALIGWRKALPEGEVRGLIRRYLESYLDQVDHYVETHDDDDYALHLENTEGPVHALLQKSRSTSRVDLLSGQTQVVEGVRQFTHDETTRRLSASERSQIAKAFEEYLTSIPENKRPERPVFYDVNDICGKGGFGIGSAGLPAYSVLCEGSSEALDNDVLLSMKQANVPAVSRFVDRGPIERYFDHEGERTVVSQRALQAHTDPLLGFTTVEGVGYVVSEVSPYENDLEWEDLNEPDVMGDVVEVLGRASAKVHCASDEDSDQTLVTFQVEEAIAASLEGRREEFVEAMTDFALEYAVRVRHDHALFVDAFREGAIGIAAT